MTSSANAVGMVAVGATDRPNVPGTVDERPNWALPLPVAVEDLATDPRVRRLAETLSNGMTELPS